MVARVPIPSTADLRGAVRLATDATTGVTDLVEAVHAGIARVPGLPRRRAPGRTGGITGLVYRSVRGITRLSGGAADLLLAMADPGAQAASAASGPRRDAWLAALNGVVGDHLAATANPLATAMRLRHGGRALVLARDALATALPDAGEDLLVLVHGLCMNDRQWSRNGHDHGAALARDAGFTPVYLHYNTGLPIADNGRLLAQAMQALVDQWPRRVRRLVLLGHSMGGLVARSAWHQGVAGGLDWPGRVGDLVFLGTPHLGAPLERAGHWVDVLLEAAPYAAPFARLGRLRSAGITDLRHGRLLPDGHGPAGRGGCPPLPAGVRCHALAATLGRASGDLKDRVLGDGLVPLDSALGRHADPTRSLAFPASRQWIGHGLGHLDLLDHPRVYARLLHGLA